MVEPDFLAEARAALADPHFVEMVNAAKAVGPLFYDLTREQQESVCASLRHEPDDVYGAVAMAVKPAASAPVARAPARKRKPSLDRLIAKAKAAAISPPIRAEN
jgi:hypothetical protein